MSMASRACHLSALAESDLDSIATFIAADNPTRALSFVADIRAKCDGIAANPEAYRNMARAYGLPSMAVT